MKTTPKKKPTAQKFHPDDLDLVLADLVRRGALLLKDGVYTIGDKKAVEHALLALGRARPPE